MSTTQTEARPGPIPADRRLVCAWCIEYRKRQVTATTYVESNGMIYPACPDHA